MSDFQTAWEVGSEIVGGIGGKIAEVIHDTVIEVGSNVLEGLTGSGESSSSSDDSSDSSSDDNS